jgi:hypothetical protein
MSATTDLTGHSQRTTKCAYTPHTSVVLFDLLNPTFDITQCNLFNFEGSVLHYSHSFNTTNQYSSFHATFNDKMQTFIITLAVFFFAVMVSGVAAKGNCEYTQDELTAASNTCVKLELCNPGGMCSLLSFPVCGTCNR